MAQNIADRVRTLLGCQRFILDAGPDWKWHLRYPLEKMRVAFLIHSLRRGGAERVALELAVGMQIYRIDTVMVSLLNVHDYREEPYVNLPVQFLIAPSEYKWPWSVPLMAHKLKLVLDELKPDVLQIHSPTATIVSAWAGIKIPAVQVFHGYNDTWKYSDTRSRQAAYKALASRTLLGWALRRLGCKVIVVSLSMADIVSKFFRCPADQIRCIVNGVDLEHFRFNERTVPSCPIICMVGTLYEVKRTDQAIRAFALLRTKMPRVRLRVVGDGPLRPVLESLIKELALEDGVELLGRRSDVADLLAQGHLFWQLSRYEGLPLTCIEAMATGLPIIGTDVPGIRDVVVPERTGYLVPIDDIEAVAGRSADLLSDATTYQTLSLASRQRAEEDFSKERMISQHIHAVKDAQAGCWTRLSIRN